MEPINELTMCEFLEARETELERVKPCFDVENRRDEQETELSEGSAQVRDFILHRSTDVGIVIAIDAVAAKMDKRKKEACGWIRFYKMEERQSGCLMNCGPSPLYPDIGPKWLVLGPNNFFDSGEFIYLLVYENT